jgi:hypothetical protein
MFEMNNMLIKYMGEVKLSVEDFKILDRYKGYLEIIEEYKLNVRDALFLRHQLFKDNELELFKDNENYIVNGLKRHIIDEYMKYKGD